MNFGEYLKEGKYPFKVMYKKEEGIPREAPFKIEANSTYEAENILNKDYGMEVEFYGPHIWVEPDREEIERKKDWKDSYKFRTDRRKEPLGNHWWDD